MYVTGTAGTISFIVSGFIGATTGAARDRTGSDATSVARQEAARVLAVLSPPRPKSKPKPVVKPRPTPRPTARPTSTPGTQATPTPSATAKPIVPIVPPASPTPPPPADTPAPSATPVPTSTPVPTATPAGPGLNSPVNATLSGHPWQLTGTLVVTPTTLDDGHNRYTAHGKFVVIAMTVVNQSGSAATLRSDEHFVLLDAQGRATPLADDTIIQSAEAVLATPDTIFLPAQPGRSYYVAIAFDVPADASGFTLAEVEGGQVQRLFGLGL